MTTTHVTPLRDLVQRRIDERWDDWASRHPHLAAAIDRARLVQSTTDRLMNDAGFRAALAEAEVDEQTLAQAARVVDRAEVLVRQALGAV